MMNFISKLKYSDRKTRADYIFDKYKEIFDESVLDVGADAMYLKEKIRNVSEKYIGIGYGDGIDLECNLEVLPYPFQKGEFKTVVCFDVLEHLENIHDVFTELCRVSREYVVISLPNPWADFFQVLMNGDYSNTESIKFYGLPVKRPLDRHRWFFSERDAQKFVSELAYLNGYEVIQFDTNNEDVPMGGRSLRGILGRIILRLIFRRDIDKLGLHHGTLWFVMRKLI